MDTIRFQLYDTHQVTDLFNISKFADFDKESMDILMDAVKDLSDKEFYPVFREMDREPAYWKDGGIVVHPTVKVAMEKCAELGLIGGTFKHENGGMQMPVSFHQAAMFILGAANNNLDGYPGLTEGAADLIVTFGSQQLKEKFTPKMMAGEWAGTMCLTEPEAGSSLSDVTSSAKQNADGSYSIKGQKIFISGGDHEYCENFIHLVLARIEGAPAGTKGISLFVVAKHKVAEDGSLSFNNVATVADFQKMGQRGYCTTHLTFGEEGESIGHIVGEPNKGLKYMFKMMNGARLAVGRSAIACSSAAYHASLQYANERIQGRKVSSTGKKSADQKPIAIINHADVRRMLMLQKAIYEGSLSLLFEASKQFDISHSAEGEEKEKAHTFLELLTPLVKTYPSEKGRQAVDNGLQILGGYGFCEDFVLQQYYRDVRIMAIYEGTTGIQSLDLLGRKISMKGGEGLKILVQEATKEIEASAKYTDLADYGKRLAEKMGMAQKVLGNLQPYAMEGNFERYLADATLFMEMFGIITIGWQWLKMANTAKHRLVTGDLEFDTEFYESKIHTMKFYYQYEMSRVSGIAEAIMHAENLTIVGQKELIQ